MGNLPRRHSLTGRPQWFTGAGEPSVFKWTISQRRRVIGAIMLVVAEIAVDRPTDEFVASFVAPLDAVLREGNFGKVVSHRANDLFVEVRLNIRNAVGCGRVLQFLAEADARLGSLVYQRGWFGRKSNIVMLGP